jgi:membrane protein required for colicin V production
MQSYDVLMLLVLIAAALWGYWKGFIWQLASLASIFFSYFLAFGLRVQVARLIDADPPWNMFAAMGVVYVLSSLVIWIGTAFCSTALETFKLKDFDRQIGATFGVAKGIIFCVLITFFAVTLLGQNEQARICGSTSGKFIARMLKRSSGLIPQEIHASVDPFLVPFQETLEQHQPAVAATDWTQQQAPVGQAWPEQGTVAWNQNYAPQPAPQYYQPPPYQGNYDPRYAPPQYAQPEYAPPAYDPRYAPDPRYAQPYAPPAQYQDPRYDDPRAWQPANDGRYAPPPQQYQPPPQYAPQPNYDDGTYRR